MDEMTSAANLAFTRLTPEDIVAALDAVGLRTDGRILALNSYENRVYRVGIEDDEPVVAKFYRPARWSDAAILEEHRFTRELAELDIPVVPPLTVKNETLFHTGHFRFSVSPCRPGRAPELDDHALLTQLGRLVARIHLHGETGAFSHRPRVDIESYGDDSVTWLLEHDFIPDTLVDVYEGVADHVLGMVEDTFARAAHVVELRLHADFHPGNVLIHGEQLHIVDFDDTRSGPAVQDLWMFLSGNRAEQGPQLAALLDGYSEFRRFDGAELALIEALRSLRIMHYAAWLARRWEDPAFKQAFPWFDTARFWDEHVLALREQIALLQEPPLRWQP